MTGLEWLPVIFTALGTLAAGFIAFHSERKSAVAIADATEARRQSAAAELTAKADKAKTEYIDTLEGELKIVKAALTDALDRIGKLEAAESICQAERQALIAENGRLRRRIEQERR